MINLIIAVVVDAMGELQNSEREDIKDNIQTSEDHTLKEIESLKEEIRELKQIILEQAKR